MNRRIRQLSLGLVAAAVLLGAGCGAKQPAVGGAHSSKAEVAKRAAIDAAVGGAAAGAEVHARIVPRTQRTPAPPTAVVATVTPTPTPSPPRSARPAGDVVFKETVSSTTFHPIEADADADALEQARQRVVARLAELDPPVKAVPTAEYVKRHFVRERAVRPLDPRTRERLTELGTKADGVYVDYEVEVTAERVRELRSQDRLSMGLRLLAMVVGAAFAGFLFLRLDDWTKGYLTSWLAVAAAALAGGAAALAILHLMRG